MSITAITLHFSADLERGPSSENQPQLCVGERMRPHSSRGWRAGHSLEGLSRIKKGY